MLGSCDNVITLCTIYSLLELQPAIRLYLFTNVTIFVNETEWARAKAARNMIWHEIHIMIHISLSRFMYHRSFSFRVWLKHVDESMTASGKNEIEIRSNEIKRKSDEKSNSYTRMNSCQLTFMSESIPVWIIDFVVYRLSIPCQTSNPFLASDFQKNHKTYGKLQI